MHGGGESKWRPGGEYVLQLSIYNFLAFLLIFQTSQLLKRPLTLNRAYSIMKDYLL